MRAGFENDSNSNEKSRLSSLDAVLGEHENDEATTTEDAERRTVGERGGASSSYSSSSTEDGGVMREISIALEDGDDAMECTVRVRVPTAAHRCVRCAMKTPLGVVFEDVEGKITVVEFYDESALGAKGRGVKIGDVLRACSAMVPEMKYPKMNIIGGGVGRPGWKRVMYTVGYLDTLDDVTFDQAMKAIASNAKAGDYDVELVFERL